MTVDTGTPFGPHAFPAESVYGNPEETAGPGQAIPFTTLATAIVDAVAASLTTAILAAMEGTSTTSVVIGTGAKVLTTQADKAFDGQWVKAYSEADPTKYIFGLCAYSGTTATITVATGGTGGAGTVNDWVIIVTGPQGVTGNTGAAGDLNAVDDPILAAISALDTGAGGLFARTGAGTAAKRTITGTANLITVADGTGASGNPTITVGSNVMRKDSDNTLAQGVAIVHTHFPHTKNTSPTLALADGEYQFIEYDAAAAAYTITLPTTGTGRIVLEVLNTAAVTSFALANNDKLLVGATGTTLTAINKRNRLIIEIINGFAVSQWVNVV